MLFLSVPACLRYAGWTPSADPSRAEGAGSVESGALSQSAVRGSFVQEPKVVLSPLMSGRMPQVLAVTTSRVEPHANILP